MRYWHEPMTAVWHNIRFSALWVHPNPPVKAGLDHVMEASVVPSLDLCPVGAGDLLPVPLPKTRVAKCMQDRHVRPKLFYLGPDRLGDAPGSRGRGERLG